MAAPIGVGGPCGPGGDYCARLAAYMLSGLAGYAAAETITTADQMFNENESYDKGDPPPPLPPTSLENQGLEIVPFPSQVELPWELEGYDLTDMPGPWILPGPTLIEPELPILTASAGKSGLQPTESVYQLNREIRQGVRGTAGLKSIHGPEESVTDSDYHVHFGGYRPALSINGEWHDDNGRRPNITNRQRKWLEGAGWQNIP